MICSSFGIFGMFLLTEADSFGFCTRDHETENAECGENSKKAKRRSSHATRSRKQLFNRNFYNQVSIDFQSNYTVHAFKTGLEGSKYMCGLLQILLGA